MARGLGLDWIVSTQSIAYSAADRDITIEKRPEHFVKSTWHPVAHYNALDSSFSNGEARIRSGSDHTHQLRSDNVI